MQIFVQAKENGCVALMGANTMSWGFDKAYILMQSFKQMWFPIDVIVVGQNSSNLRLPVNYKIVQNKTGKRPVEFLPK